jgi:hypothetical protein
VENRVRVGLPFIVIAGLLIVPVAVYYGVSALTSPPTPEEVVQEFRDQGLEVGKSFPIERDEGFMESPTPKV